MPKWRKKGNTEPPRGSAKSYYPSLVMCPDLGTPQTMPKP